MSSYWKEQRREDIFQAANPVFHGAKILGEERDRIITRMSNYPAQFESVVRTYGRDMVVQITSSLINNGKIAARSNVRLEVYKTHTPSTVRRRQQDALEEAAAQSEAKAMDEASRSVLHLYQGDQGGEQTDLTGHIFCLVLVLFRLICMSEDGLIEDPSESVSSSSPSLFPSYLSYISQHKLLNTVQRVLEDCCYDWVSKWMPSLLEERKWTCSEAVELGRWSTAIPTRFDTFSSDATSLGSGEALLAVFLATHPLRHAAVHRLRTSVRGLERMLENALKMVTALKDTRREGKLHDILEKFRSTVRAMEVNKIELEISLDKELGSIQQQRIALDNKERGARLGMFQQDREHTAQVSSLFESSIRNLIEIDESSMTDMEQCNARSPEIEGAYHDTSAAVNSIEHSAEDLHQTAGNVNSGNTNSKSRKHNDNELRTADAISENNSTDDHPTATVDTGCANGDSEPGVPEDIAAWTADAMEVTGHPIEDESPITAAELDLDDSILPLQSFGGEVPPESFPELIYDYQDSY